MDYILSEEERMSAITKHLEALAWLTNSSGHAWMLVKEGGGTVGSCSPTLEGYAWALRGVVERAAITPFDVNAPPEDDANQPSTSSNPRPKKRLLQSSELLHEKLRAKHVELHPIVAALIEGLNEIDGHKVPRSEAVDNPHTMPPWFPHGPKVYAKRAQRMDLAQLYAVIDAVFEEIQRDLQKIQALQKYVLKRTYDPLGSGIGMWAGIKCFFDALEQDAIAHGGKVGARQAGAAGGGVENSGFLGGEFASSSEEEASVSAERSMEIEQAFMHASPGEPPDFNSLMSPGETAPGPSEISPESCLGGRRVRPRTETAAGVNPRLAIVVTGDLAPAQEHPAQIHPPLNLSEGGATSQAQSYNPQADVRDPRFVLQDDCTTPTGHVSASEAPGSPQLTRQDAKNARQTQEPSQAGPVLPRSRVDQNAAAPSFARSETSLETQDRSPQRETSIPRSLRVNLTRLFRRGFGLFLPEKGVLLRQNSAKTKGRRMRRQKSLKATADAAHVDFPRAINLTHSAPGGLQFLQPQQDDVIVFRRSNSERQRRKRPVRTPRGGSIPDPNVPGTPPGWESPTQGVQPEETECEAFPVHREFEPSESFKSGITVEERERADESEECENFPFPRPVRSELVFESAGVNGHAEAGAQYDVAPVVNGHMEGATAALERGLLSLRLSSAGPVHTVPPDADKHPPGVLATAFPSSKGSHSTSGTITSGTVTSGTLATGSVANGTVVSGAVASGTVSSGTVVSRTVVSGMVASETVVSGSAVSGNVASGTFASDMVVGGTVASGSAPRGTVGNGTVATNTVASGADGNGTLLKEKVATATLADPTFSNPFRFGEIDCGRVAGGAPELEDALHELEGSHVAACGCARAHEDSHSSLDGPESPSSVLRGESDSRRDPPAAKLFQTEVDGES